MAVPENLRDRFGCATRKKVQMPGETQGRMLGLRKTMAWERTTSGAVRCGGVHKRLRKKEERGGMSVLLYSEGPA
jgi:hypothetical protein